MAGEDRSQWWINGINYDHLILGVALNVLSMAVITGYVTVEYVVPYIKRKWQTYSIIRDRLQLPKSISLNKYEEELAASAIDPKDTETSYADVGGMENVIHEIERNIHALTKLSKRSKLVSAPSGMLLYGPPGCGKTLVAKAIARESGARFLNINLATILDKWVGETEKYVDALFSLANKIAPCIIFIDEIDCLTRRRSVSDRDYSASMKSQFLTLWDGLGKSNQGVLVLGATNRREDIDEAFLRRMPLQIHIPLPNLSQREAILRVLLSDLNLTNHFDYHMIAERTSGFSGSDLRELCRRCLLVHDAESFTEATLTSFIAQIN